MKKFRVALILALCSLMIFALTACAPKVESLTSKYEKDGYTVTAGKNTLTAVKSNEDGISYVFVTWCDNKEDANKAEESAETTAKNLVNTYNSTLGLLGNKLDDKDFSVKRKGNVIAIGTKEALKKF